MLIDPEDNVAEADLEGPERFSLLQCLRHPLRFTAAWRELRYSRKAARLALDRYQGLQAERPDLTGRALYEAFVCDRNAIEASAARVILQRAEASFATWPADRDLKFMDVLKYLVISEYLVSHPKRRAPRSTWRASSSRLFLGSFDNRSSNPGAHATSRTPGKRAVC